MLRYLPVVALPLIICWPSVGHAAKVKVWHHCFPAHYDKAQLKQAVVSSEGAIRLSRRLKPLLGVDATHVWDIVEDTRGNLFIATGDDGKLYKASKEGKLSIAFDSGDSQVLCLALSADGSVYAGTGPSGLIIRVPPEGKGEIIYRGPDSYVWCLAVDSSGESIFAGTGPTGRIYRLNSKGQASLFYATRQEHILCLKTGPNQTIYAGTDKNGLIYRFSATGKPFIIYHAPQAEVRSLLVTPDALYAGTSSPRRHLVPSAPSKLDRLSSAVQPVLTGNSQTETKIAPHPHPTAERPSTSTSSSKEKEEKNSSATVALNPGENSLYRIAMDGTVREIFREKALLLSLLREPGRIFIGTGMEGQLFEVDEISKERSEIARLDHCQIHCMCQRKDGSIVLGTGDPGKLYLLEGRYAGKGTVLSEVLDAKIISKWGSLRWTAKTPAGTHVSVAVRSGNLAEPDETWSDWSGEYTVSEQATINAPPARFLQYRLTLSTDNPEISPTVQSVALRYMTTNQSPEISSLEVPDLDATNLENPKKLRLKWSASDPNDDDLTFALYIRKEGWKSWVQLEDNLEKKEYEWDTTTTPSGMYQIKVIANDRKDNPSSEALTVERVSSIFPVAHDSPGVSLRFVGMEGRHAILEAVANDALVRLTAASFAVNGKKWINVFPTDGLFDSRRESFRFKTQPLLTGTHVIVLRVRDAAGNLGSGDVVFTVPTSNDP